MTHLITGAGGYLGSALTKALSATTTVRAFDTHEYSLSKLKHDNVRLLLGDVCDYERLSFAMREGVDVCIACASYKNIDITEYSLEQTFKTNIIGTLNTAKACMAAEVKSAILISSDKAVEPISAYGVSKLAQEQIWLWASRIQANTKFIIVRLGNIIGSTGGVHELWKGRTEVEVTHPQCERWFINVYDAVKFILNAEEHPLKQGLKKTDFKHGHTYIPLMESQRIYDIALAQVGTPDKIIITGLRHGEKVIEKLYSQDESTRVKELSDCYEIRP